MPGTADIVRLPGSDLSNRQLVNADFKFADLTGTNLPNANVNHASLAYANLANADFTSAHVRGLDLTFATRNGFTPEQLYSTSNYSVRDLRNIRLNYNDLSG